MGNLGCHQSLLWASQRHVADDCGQHDAGRGDMRKESSTCWKGWWERTREACYSPSRLLSEKTVSKSAPRISPSWFTKEVSLAGYTAMWSPASYLGQ